jgi:thiol-disulfide isomerase/thioredoxin
MRIDLSNLRKKTVSINQYIANLKQPFRKKFLIRKQMYKPKHEVLTQLRKIAGRYVVIAFSAEWCKDCTANIPVLAIISEATGLEVRVFGGLMKDPLNPTRKWRIPPSPPEVEIFKVDKIPLILVTNTNGEEIGRIIENPVEPTIEEEILRIILDKEKFQQV